MRDPYIYLCPVTNRYYDPLRLRRELRLSAEDYGAEFNELLDRARLDDAKAEAALYSICRAAFALPPVHPSGAGFTDATVADALEAFLRWQRGKGQRERHSPDAAPSTALPHD